VHLLRLKALPAEGLLADSLLNDHEDNLYLHGWGMANEPVYNQQATAYLLRDDPVAAIRAFYSYLACAFSHSALEPVEHRWTWGQYFGPPSTDGWFSCTETFTRCDGSLLLLGATPRRWLADGQQIAVERAPTYYGEISVTVDSHAGSGTLTARIEIPKRRPMKRLLVRFRHPEAKPMQAVTVNGENWTGFDGRRMGRDRQARGTAHVITADALLPSVAASRPKALAMARLIRGTIAKLQLTLPPGVALGETHETLCVAGGHSLRHCARRPGNGADTAIWPRRCRTRGGSCSVPRPAGDWDLFLCRPDGSDLRNISSTPQYNEAAPQFSRDGRRLLIGDCRENETISGNRYGEQGQLIFANGDGTEAEIHGESGQYRGRAGARTASRSPVFRSKGSRLSTFPPGRWSARSNVRASFSN
jgi:hypothetical protein